MAVTKAAMRLLIISYASAVLILLLLLLTAQVLIQASLYDEQQKRALSAQINAQELRTERMLRNVILLQNPAPDMDYAAITRELESESIIWERTQEQIEQTGLFGARAAYDEMRKALYRIFVLEHADADGAPPEQVRPDVGIFFLHEPEYKGGLIKAYDANIARANGRVAQVRVTEAVLFALSLIVIVAEYLFVVRPALRHLTEQMQIIAESLAREEDKAKKTEKKEEGVKDADQ